jgi:hypothetical protein
MKKGIYFPFSVPLFMTENIRQLPAELDNDTVLFSYGSLLEHETLRKLLKNRGEFQILETVDAAEAARLARDNPADIIILRGVRLENVRVSVVTETMLRRWYQNRGGDVEEIIAAGVTTREISPALFLCARPAKPVEKGKSLNGGLICNLSQAELRRLDKYEWKPVLQRTRAPELIIQDRVFVPERITFYAVTTATGEITAEEKAERAGLLNLNRQPGRLSPQARWQKNVRRK